MREGFCQLVLISKAAKKTRRNSQEHFDDEKFSVLKRKVRKAFSPHLYRIFLERNLYCLAGILLVFPN